MTYRLDLPLSRDRVVMKAFAPPRFIVLPPEPPSVRHARAFVSHVVESWGLDLAGVTLVVSELVTNAVMHAGHGAVSVCVVRTDAALLVEVVDSLPDVVPLIPVPGTHVVSSGALEHRHGLRIASAHADALEVQVDREAGTKTLRATFVLGACA